MDVRTFVEADRDELVALFARAGEGSPNANLWGHLESEADIYLVPYMDREPDSLFLAVADGSLVGYLAGCLDSAAFPSESQRFTQVIKKHRLILKPKPAAFFARALVDGARGAIRREEAAKDFADDRWPAHLHINVAPEARGTGAADGLMNCWFDRLRATGSSGCYLQTLVENTRAVRFFERVGFVKHGPTSTIPGARYQGRRVHQQTMVWTPDPTEGG